MAVKKKAAKKQDKALGRVGLKEQAKVLGKRVHVEFGTGSQRAKVLCVVEDFTSQFGVARYLVVPAEGKGSTWVEKIELVE